MLSVVTRHPLIAEVIVVDDGSTDRTRDIVQAFPTVHLISNRQNCGKTASVCRGVLESTQPYLFLVDADLTGLTVDTITTLLNPVLKKEVIISMSLKRYYPWRYLGFDPITGERVMPRSLLTPLIPELQALPPFALEIFINRYIIANDIPITFVPCLNVSAPIKAMKRGIRIGMRDEARMWLNITNFMPVHKLLRQFYTLWRLSRRDRYVLPTHIGIL